MIFACLLGDRLRSRLDAALRNDLDLLRAVRHALPRNLPPTFAKKERAKVLREITLHLATARPNAGPWAIAETIATAAAQVEKGDDVLVSGWEPFERAMLQSKLTDLASWAPRQRDGRWAPSARTIYRAISSVF